MIIKILQTLSLLDLRNYRRKNETNLKISWRKI